MAIRKEIISYLDRKYSMFIIGDSILGLEFVTPRTKGHLYIEELDVLSLDEIVSIIERESTAIVDYYEEKEKLQAWVISCLGQTGGFLGP
jgi:hypothetical protein